MTAINLKAEAALPPERRRELFENDPETGQVIWHRRDGDVPAPLDPTVQVNVTASEHLIGEFALVA